VSERARLLADHLRHRRRLGERELFCEQAGRDEILTRVRRLIDGDPGSGGEPQRDLGEARSAPVGQRSGESAPKDAEIARLAREGTAGEILELADLERLRAVADACSRCALHQTRTNPVFADGSAEARVMCVGEAPGQKEDETGIPFVGRAGQLLDRLLAAVGLGREGVFICNVLKCRPPGNRNPEPEEIERCSPYLVRQLELVDPEVVIAFGTFAARTLLDSRESLGKLRERTHLYRGRPLIVTYHPAALLRNPGWIRPTWEDLQRVRGVLDGGGDEAEDRDRR
jgi:DNA polymerase